MFVISELPQEHNAIPKRNQVIINQSFIGKGHEVEKMKKDKRKITQQYYSLSYEVTRLNKMNASTAKEIEKQQEHIKYMIDTKKRRRSQKQQKQRINNQRQEKLHQLHGRLKDMKNNSSKNTDGSIYGLTSQGKDHSHQNKSKQLTLKIQLKQDQKSDLDKRRNKRKIVNDEKYLGLMRIVDFKSQRNKKYLDSYNDQIREQQNIIDCKTRDMKQLQQQKLKAMQLLQQRNRVSQRLQEVIDNAGVHEIQFLQKKYNDIKNQTKGLCYIRKTIRNKSTSQISSIKQQKRSCQIHKQISKKQRINNTVQLIQKSDIFSIIKEIDDPQTCMSRKKSKRRRKTHSKKKSTSKLYLTR